MKTKKLSKILGKYHVKATKEWEKFSNFHNEMRSILRNNVFGEEHEKLVNILDNLKRVCETLDEIKEDTRVEK